MKIRCLVILKNRFETKKEFIENYQNYFNFGNLIHL